MEVAAVDYLKSQLDFSKYQPFVLTKEFFFWDKGIPVLFKKLLFPSYVIVKTSCESTVVLADLKPILKNHRDVIYKILAYDNSECKNIMLYKSEQTMWASLVDSDFCITASEGKLDDGKLKIISGPLLGKEHRLKTVNKYKRKAIIDVEFAGELIEISVALKLSK